MAFCKPAKATAGIALYSFVILLTFCKAELINECAFFAELFYLLSKSQKPVMKQGL